MYRKFREVVERYGGQFVPHLTKYLDEVAINDWSDLTRANLEDLRDAMLEDVAKSSAKTYLAKFKAIVDRFKDEPEIDIPCTDISGIMKMRSDETVKTFLKRAELTRLEGVETHSDMERLVKHIFLIGAYTGMRTSDIRRVREENVVDGKVSYVSQKTGVAATIPLRKRILEYIEDIQENDDIVRYMSRQMMNKSIKSLCKRAGINDGVTTHRGGVTRQGEKWRFVTMHTARISFCSNLAKLHVSIYDIARLAGHKNIGTTERYIVAQDVELNDRQMGYFQ